MLVSANRDNMVFKLNSMTGCEKKLVLEMVGRVQTGRELVLAEMTQDEIRVKAPRDIMYTMLFKLSNHCDVELM